MTNANERPELSVERFKELVDELKVMGVSGIEFCGGGEPLLYPGIEEVIKYITNKQIQLGVFTNGSMLNKYYKLLIVM